MKSQSEPAISRIAIAGVLLAVVVVAAIGAYFVLTPSSQKSSTQATSVTVTSIPPSPLIAPGQTQNYTTIQIAENGLGPLGTVNVRVFPPSGVTITLNQSSVPLSSTPQRIPVSIHATNQAAVGNYSVVVETSGQGISAANGSIRIDVVPMLVVMKYPSFYPQNVTVTKGTRVTWMNLNGYITCCDPGEHNVSFATGANYTSATISTFQTVSYTFNADGTFEYYCTIHPIMRGQVTVTG